MKQKKIKATLNLSEDALEALTIMSDSLSLGKSAIARMLFVGALEFVKQEHTLPVWVYTQPKLIEVTNDE